MGFKSSSGLGCAVLRVVGIRLRSRDTEPDHSGVIVCQHCHGRAEPDELTVVSAAGDSLLRASGFRCTNCGREFFDEGQTPNITAALRRIVSRS
jgi:hypothetical protein